MRIVASITTIPSRLLNICPVIRSLLDQTRPFDRVYVNVPQISRRGVSYPLEEFFELLQAEGLRGTVGRDDELCSDPVVDRLHINVVDYDLGPIMKTLPVLHLEHDPLTRIVSFDDDHLVNPRTAEMLERYIGEHPDKALSLSGYTVGCFPFLFEYVWNVSEVSAVDWILGVSIIVYRRDWLNFEDLSDYNHIEDPSLRQMFIKNDDHWINYWLARHGVIRAVVPERQSAYLQPLDSQGGISQGPGFLEENYRLADYLRQQGIYRQPNIKPYYTAGAVVLLILLGIGLGLAILLGLGVPLTAALVTAILIYCLVFLLLGNVVRALGSLRYYLLVPVIVLLVGLGYSLTWD